MAADSDMYGIGKSGLVESSYQVNDDVSIPVYADVQLYPCSNCGRNFNPDTLVGEKNKSPLHIESIVVVVVLFFLQSLA